MFGIGLKILSFFTEGGVQGIFSNVADLYKARLAAGEDQSKLAADLAARQLALDSQDARLQASLTAGAKWYSPRELMGYGVAFYVVKILCWDKQHYDYTEPLDDKLWWVVTTIIIAYFGARAVRDLVTGWRK